MKNKIGETVYATSEIAGTFQSYYGALYSVRQKRTQKKESKRNQKIKEYLREAKLPKASAEKLLALKDPITQGEINLAMKKYSDRKKSRPQLIYDL